MKLAEKRKENGLSQAGLAALTGIPVKTIRHYEQGTRNINGAKIATLKTLAKVLKCEIDDILED